MKAEQLLYAKTHEWVDVQTDASGGKIAVIGVSDFALEVLTDLVFMELPQVGRQLAAGDAFGEIESVKAVSSLYCPVGGEIVEVNSQLADNLEGLAADPFGAGWLVKVKISDESGLATLMDHAAYRKQCEAEEE